jgi:hypothetical protein
VNPVIGADEARYTEEPARLRVGRTGTGFPPVRARVRVSVECSNHDGAEHDRWRAQVQGCLSTRSGAAREDNGGRVIHKDPPTLFVPLNWIARK